MGYRKDGPAPERPYVNMTREDWAYVGMIKTVKSRFRISPEDTAYHVDWILHHLPESPARQAVTLLASREA